MTFRLWWIATLAAVFLISAWITHNASSSFGVVGDFALSVGAAFVVVNVIGGFVELRNRRRTRAKDKEL